MNREVPFEPDAVCDDCGAKGAYDFMGNFICSKCLDEMYRDAESDLEDE